MFAAFLLAAIVASISSGYFMQPTALTLALRNAVSDEPSRENARSRKLLLACGALRRADTHYVLENDVQSGGTCFSIQADNITLDLNGHTLTYATSDGAKATFGVLAADCWDKSLSGNPCDGNHGHAVIMNGKIVQGAAAAPMSHGIRFGQANNLTGVTVHDLDITIAAPDSIGIYSEYLPGGSDVYRNTIHNNVTAISSRHQFRGMSIKLAEEAEAKLPDLIHDNIILGGAQAGIRSDNPAGTKIYGNDISQNATYTNGFCIDAAGKGMEVYGNRCHPVRGRGIHTNATGVTIHDNIIETIDSDKNQEYQGCEINGTYGIQAESDGRDPGNIRVYHNQVKVHAAECPAAAMRLTDLNNASVRIYDNTFLAVQDIVGPQLSSQPARGFSVGNVVGDHISFTHNLVQADTAIFSMDWDGGSDIKLDNNIFKAGTHGTATLLAEFGNGVAPSQGNVFEDNELQGFAPSAKFGEYTGDSWLVIASGLTVHITDQNGKPVPGARVQFADEVYHPASEISDVDGDVKILVPMMQLRSKLQPKKYVSYTLIISSAECGADHFSVPQPQPKRITRTLSCHSGS